MISKCVQNAAVVLSSCLIFITIFNLSERVLKKNFLSTFGISTINTYVDENNTFSLPEPFTGYRETNSTYKSKEVKTLNSESSELFNFGYNKTLLEIAVRSEILVYNRVHKCGSTTFNRYLKELQRRNGFHLQYSNIHHGRNLNTLGQKIFAKRVSALRKPALFVRHVFFVDFERFGYEQPIYMNLLRDPVDRMTSQYYYDRVSHRQYLADRVGSENLNKTINQCVQEKLDECVNLNFNKTHKLWAIVPYFCGQDPICKYPNRIAVKIAKRNVEKYFVVVGILEDLKSFVVALETILPTFFKDFKEFYKSMGKVTANETRKTKSTLVLIEKPTTETRQYLKDKLSLEYDFYNFAKQRFKIFAAQMKIKVNLKR